MSELDILKEGKLYKCNDLKLLEIQIKQMDLIAKYNKVKPSNMKKRIKVIKKIFGNVGENVYIEIPLHASWGMNTHIGSNFYANFNLTLVDDESIYIGDNVLMGPNVTLVTAGHPINPDLRIEVYQFNEPIHIENNVWLGANVTVLPGVTIGENTVIGAGSIVNKDIPSNVVAVGVPCKVLRQIGDYDKEYYFKNKKINIGEQN